jgi:hypothetical protein
MRVLGDQPAVRDDLGDAPGFLCLFFPILPLQFSVEFKQKLAIDVP